MITNPQIGQRVVVSDRRLDRGRLYGQMGVIVRLGTPYLEVKLDDQLVYSEPILLSHLELDLVDLTPEEQAQIDDQQRRQAHADKYL